MPRLVDIGALQNRTSAMIGRTALRYTRAAQNVADFQLLRWIAQMSAVELNVIWERYVEKRIVAALNHDSAHFLTSNNIVGVRRVSAGLADFIIRGGKQYFDFRDCSDLLGRTNQWLTRARNPFSALSQNDRMYLDTLSAIRNSVAHQSNAATRRYKSMLRRAYNIRSAPAPEEFLNAIDYRQHSPARGFARIIGLSEIVAGAVVKT